MSQGFHVPYMALDPKCEIAHIIGMLQIEPWPWVGHAHAAAYGTAAFESRLSA